MLSLAAIWIDSVHAKIFNFTGEKTEILQLKPHGPRHHAETTGVNHTKAEGDSEKFYHEVAEFIEKSPEAKWLVMGAGLGHTHFVHHIQRHHPRYAKNIIGSQTTDHLTDPQITALAKKIFIQEGLMEAERESV